MKPETLTDLFSLEGRVALVTGASGDLGRAMTRGLALAGASIALTGRSESKLLAVQEELQPLGVQTAIFPADLSELEAIPELVDAVIMRFGRLDILLNCAGVNQRMPIEEVTPEIYERIMDTNLRSIYFLSQAVLPHLIAQKGGKIIHIGSLTSTTGLASVSVYGMAKSALSQLTRTMAIEWAEHNIQVNCLCPGFFKTELTATVWEQPEKSRWMLERIPQHRAGKPEELIGLALYLASPASSYTTGQTMYIDGGFLAGSQW